MELKDAKKQAEEENPGHSFVWSDYGTYGRPKFDSYGKCRYCTAEIAVHLLDKQKTIGTDTKCLSIGRTLNPEGLAVTTWAYCRKCGKKINQNNKNEVLKGFHSKCQDTFGGYLVLDTRKGNVQVSFFDGLEDYKASL